MKSKSENTAPRGGEGGRGKGGKRGRREAGGLGFAPLPQSRSPHSLRPAAPPSTIALISRATTKLPRPYHSTKPYPLYLPNNSYLCKKLYYADYR